MLGFQMDSNAKDNLKDSLFDVKQPADFREFEADYMFVNVENTNNPALQEEFAEVLGIPSDHVILLNSEDYITNDLISVREQTEYIVNKINEAGE